MSKDKEKDKDEKVVATNRKAFHDYHIEDKLEAGIMLRGTEVKSLRAGLVNLRDSYASVNHGEVFLHNCHINPYSHGNIMNHEPLRTRKLLLHQKEITQLIGKTQQKGLTLLTGEGGMGKTLLARRILDGLEEEIFEATLLVMLPGAAAARAHARPR